MSGIRSTLRRLPGLLFWSIALALLMVRSDVLTSEEIVRLRVFTRDIEFNYVTWIIDALSGKLVQTALGGENYLPAEGRPKLVLDYIKLVEDIQRDEARLNDIYADPDITDPQKASTPLREELQELYQKRAQLAPLVESVLQGQISSIVAETGLTLGGQTIPPVMFHSTSLPLALIVSPRAAIRQDFDISLIPELTVDQQVTLEGKVDNALDVSSLVVPVGGLGIYPTMVMQTTDINWLSEVVAHEWIHNFLTLRPLGFNYYGSPELRTMNETAASIAGKEIGRALVRRFYPEFLPPEQPPPQAGSETAQTAEPPAFDFRKEMHTTRVVVDELLAEGEIEQAESYMEERRRFFWEHGYHIRKLNQAYFAFYGAYADQPGGAAGEDPVGAAVRLLRTQSPTLADFIKRISLMYSFEQLQRAVNGVRQ